MPTSRRCSSSALAVLPVLARARAERPDLRVIALTTDAGRTAIAGIDELLSAGVQPDELVGRVVVHLAHARAAAPRRLPVAEDTVLDLDARALRRRGRLIHLRPVESRLLEELARSPGRPLSRDWLMERAWSSPPPTGSRTVDVHVRWLRQKLEPDPRRPIHLLTVRGLGYRLEPDPDGAADPGAWA
jgi:DNA-binding response OmpR family regulator